MPCRRLAATELLTHGAGYAARCIEAAHTLATALGDPGLVVAGADRGFTQSHHVALVLPETTTGDRAVARLARAGVHVSATWVGAVAVLRLGTQELVTRGFEPRDFRTIAAG